MTRLLCKIAIIGFIAMNSPLLAGKPAETEKPAALREIAVAAHAKAQTAASSITAAREAAQILAGLDPEMRERLLGATASLGARPVQR